MKLERASLSPHAPARAPTIANLLEAESIEAKHSAEAFQEQSRELA